MIVRVIILVILSSLTIACGERVGSIQETKSTTFYLIRHAEKDRSNPKDQNPNLTPSGLKRAKYWSSYFDTIPLNSVYTTDFNRTKQTILPVCNLKNITPEIYSPNNINIQEFIKKNKGKNVLISGHSNTTPAMVNKLINKQEFDDMSDSDNKSLFVVKIINSDISFEVRSVPINQ